MHPIYDIMTYAVLISKFRNSNKKYVTIVNLSFSSAFVRWFSLCNVLIHEIVAQLHFEYCGSSLPGQIWRKCLDVAATIFNAEVVVYLRSGRAFFDIHHVRHVVQYYALLFLQSRPTLICILVPVPEFPSSQPLLNLHLRTLRLETS